MLDDIEREQKKKYLFDLVSRGEIPLDGIMSPLTQKLMLKFDTKQVNMTEAWAITPTSWNCPCFSKQRRKYGLDGARM